MGPIGVRELVSRDESVLHELIWLAVHWDKEAPPPSPTRLPQDVARYVTAFGRKGDRGLLALAQGRPVGACWVREMFSGYGFVAAGIGELSMAVRPGFRRKGIGGDLLAGVLAEERDPISLSVDPTNPARRLYERFGFARVDERDGSWIMLRGNR